MRWFGLAILVLVSINDSFSEDRLAEETFFQSIQGSWIGSGQLTDVDGKTTDIQEDWTGSYLEDGSFEMKGTRLWGEDNQEFYWRFAHNASLDLVECEYWHTGVEEPIRFEVSLTENSAELRAPFGEPGGQLLVSNRFFEESIEGLVSLTQPDGSESLSGTMVHKREKESAE